MKTNSVAMRVGFLAACLLCTAPHAQTFPTKSLRMIVPSSANSGGDFIARIIGLFDREFKELDRTKRAAMWTRIQQILMGELPGIPLWEYPVLNVVSAKFADVVTEPHGYLQSLEKAHLK